MLRDEAISGKLILGATLLALIVANTGLKSIYEALWQTDLNLGLGNWVLSQDLRHWVNEGLMAIFFLVVGLELKRELVKGELKKFKTASLPIAAAIGGMIIPAVLYMSLNMAGDGFRGWAIPMATDIAFAIGILAFLGKRIPSSLRIFLLTLAIVDDIGAVIIIAVVYSTGINLAMLLLATVISIFLLLMRRNTLLTMPIFVIAGITLWLAVNGSGVHASIAGALLGLLAPLGFAAKRRESIAESLERFTIPISTLLIIPLFAFANTGIILSFNSFQNDDALPIAGGIVLGLVVGKVIGIVLASWLMVRLKFSDLPYGSSWSHIIGVGLLAGIGFTVSIFMAEIAFTDQQFIDISKLAIFAASAISGALGFAVLKLIPNKPSV